MNNFTFGDEGMGYYETIAGGAGAGPGWHGRRCATQALRLTSICASSSSARASPGRRLTSLDDPACAHFCSGVHTHMTNTRITDPEILERRYPVVLHQFRLRPGGLAGSPWRLGSPSHATCAATPGTGGCLSVAVCDIA